MATKASLSVARSEGAIFAQAPEARRAPQGLYRSLVERLPCSGVNLWEILEFEAGEDQAAFAALNNFAGPGEVWRPLAAAYGKCDCMVPGKYKKARAFAFETPNLYVWCHAETGDRGTTWLMAEKTAKPLAAAPWGYSHDRPTPARRSELALFFRSVAVASALAYPPTMDLLAQYPPAKAAAEARAIAAAAPKVGEAARRRAPGL